MSWSGKVRGGKLRADALSCQMEVFFVFWFFLIDDWLKDVIRWDFWQHSPSRLLVHGGHLFFRCHLSCQWQMTQRQPGGTGRTHSPQAKLVQDLVHLPKPPHPRYHSPPIQSLHPLAHSSHAFLILLLTLQCLISSPLMKHLPFSFSLSLTHGVIVKV